MKNEMTVVNKFNAVKDALVQAGAAQELVTFIEERIAIDEKRRATAKAYRAKKAGEKSDELIEAVKAALGEDVATAQDIADKMNEAGVTNAKGEPITKNMVIARMTKLVKAGDAFKGKAKNDEGKIVTVYSLTDVFSEEDAE